MQGAPRHPAPLRDGLSQGPAAAVVVGGEGSRGFTQGDFGGA